MISSQALIRQAFKDIGCWFMTNAQPYYEKALKALKPASQKEIDDVLKIYTTVSESVLVNNSTGKC